MLLALGTVQFGLAYGIAGSGQAVAPAETRRILQAAWAFGVRTLDTAAAYGDIEERLARLCDGLPFRVISKVPALSAGWSDPVAAASWAVEQARQSHRRLGPLLAGLMCHRAEDLLGQSGAAIHAALQAWAKPEGIALGVSCYDPATLLTLASQRQIQIAQLPGNALDQRLAQQIPTQPPGLEIHLRSAFLQGLLLMPGAQGARRLPAAAAALQRWHGWCARHGLAPLPAALSAVKSFAAVSTVVVGVDSLAQFDAIAQAWSSVRAIHCPELAEASAAIIDPRTWTP